MRLLIKTLSWTFAVLVLVALGLSALIFMDSRPLVDAQAGLTAAERAWIQSWIRTNRPEARRSEMLTTLRLNEHQANLLLGAFVDRIGEGRARVKLSDGKAFLSASLRLPLDESERYLNVELELFEDDHLVKVDSARVAGLPLPAILVETLAERAIRAIDRAQLIERVDLAQDALQVSYVWHPDMLERIGSSLVPEADLPGVLAFQARLEVLAATHPNGTPIELADLLSDLLSQAGVHAQTNPVGANRALILALAAYVNGRVIHAPADSASASPARPHKVVLRGRADLSQHFMTSAAIATQGNDTLSSLVGWYKEMSDANGGSGFSFADMTANRAGIRFAKLATESQASAQRLQAMARDGLSADDFMPLIQGLPEGMTRSNFASGFGDPKTGQYRRMLTNIDRRIDASRLFQRSPG